MNDKVTREEVEKWLRRIEPLVGGIKASDSRGEKMLVNMKAYISDSRHFLERGDLVRAFEAVIWAWAIFEICTELDIFKNVLTQKLPKGQLHL